MKNLNVVALILVIVGGLNWGLVAFGYNLVESLFGAGSAVTTLVYALVGISAVFLIFSRPKAA